MIIIPIKWLFHWETHIHLLSAFIHISVLYCTSSRFFFCITSDHQTWCAVGCQAATSRFNSLTMAHERETPWWTEKNLRSSPWTKSSWTVRRHFWGDSPMDLYRVFLGFQPRPWIYNMYRVSKNHGFIWIYWYLLAFSHGFIIFIGFPKHGISRQK